MSYLIDKYKGKYRLLCEYDKNTNDFARKLNGTYEDIDVFVSCYNNIRVYHYSGNILQAYIPSIGRGRNIVLAIQKINPNILYDIEETDAEILFKFRYSDSEIIMPLLKPKTSGANISPFSSKNLPKNKDYKIPDEDLLKYKSIVEKIPKNRILELTHITNSFLKSFVTKKKSWDSIRSDMRIKGLKGKEYIHSIGKWDSYIKYLQERI